MKRVVVNDRIFIVRHDEAGEPYSIRERKPVAPGVLRDLTYWHRTHPRGRDGSIVNRIIRAATGGSSA